MKFVTYLDFRVIAMEWFHQLFRRGPMQALPGPRGPASAWIRWTHQQRSKLFVWYESRARLTFLKHKSWFLPPPDFNLLNCIFQSIRLSYPRNVSTTSTENCASCSKSMRHWLVQNHIFYFCGKITQKLYQRMQGLITELEEAMLSFFIDYPTAIYDCHLPNSYCRLMLHAVAQYHRMNCNSEYLLHLFKVY